MAEEAAAASFKDLAALRANVDRTIASTYSARDATVRSPMSNSSVPLHRREGADEEEFTSSSVEDPLECSLVILETDALLQHYKHHFAEPAGTSRGDWSVFRAATSSAARADVSSTLGSMALPMTLPMVQAEDAVPDAMKEQEIFSFLDKYSDRLADMVQQKVAAKEKEKTSNR